MVKIINHTGGPIRLLITSGPVDVIDKKLDVDTEFIVPKDSVCIYLEL